MHSQSGVKVMTATCGVLTALMQDRAPQTPQKRNKGKTKAKQRQNDGKAKAEQKQNEGKAEAKQNEGFIMFYSYKSSFVLKGWENKHLASSWAMSGLSWEHFGTSLAILNDFGFLLERF